MYFTATGTKATEGRTIAVDPSVIPYGSEVAVFYDDGRICYYIAEDCGAESPRRFSVRYGAECG